MLQDAVAREDLEAFGWTRRAHEMPSPVERSPGPAETGAA